MPERPVPEQLALERPTPENPSCGRLNDNIPVRNLDPEFVVVRIINSREGSDMPEPRSITQGNPIREEYSTRKELEEGQGERREQAPKGEQERVSRRKRDPSSQKEHGSIH